jgi:hypothetical protein
MARNAHKGTFIAAEDPSQLRLGKRESEFGRMLTDASSAKCALQNAHEGTFIAAEDPFQLRSD